MTTSLIPLVDCDLLNYRCGFSCKPGEPLEHSLAATKTTIGNILARFQEKQDQAYLSISGPTNFRNDVATILPYKGNRDPSHKPEFYKEIKEYLINVWGAVKSVDEEPDDVLGQMQTEETCIVSNDKDMLMIPGHHYIWTKDTWLYRTQEDADSFFWFQMMTGDKQVDNIPGLKGYGPPGGKASAIVMSCEGDLNRLRSEVEQLYNKQYGSDWEAVMNEIGTLLWIRRKGYLTWRSYFDR